MLSVAMTDTPTFACQWGGVDSKSLGWREREGNGHGRGRDGGWGGRLGGVVSGYKCVEHHKQTRGVETWE